VDLKDVKVNMARSSILHALQLKVSKLKAHKSKVIDDFYKSCLYLKDLEDSKEKWLDDTLKRTKETSGHVATLNNLIEMLEEMEEFLIHCSNTDIALSKSEYDKYVNFKLTELC